MRMRAIPGRLFRLLFIDGNWLLEGIPLLSAYHCLFCPTVVEIRHEKLVTIAIAVFFLVFERIFFVEIKTAVLGFVH